MGRLSLRVLATLVFALYNMHGNDEQPMTANDRCVEHTLLGSP